MTINKFSKILKMPVLMVTLVIAAVVVLGGLRIMFYIQSPDIVFLADRAGAQWIKYDSAFDLEIKPASRTRCEFKYIFNTGKKVDHARITVQALKRCQVFFDGIDVFSSADEFNEWKKTHDIKIPFTIDAGPHEILVMVTSENSYPALIAYSENLPVRTGAGWFASNDGKDWRMAVPASQLKQPAISKKYPSSAEALIKIWPYLAILFAGVLFISLFAGWHEDGERKFFNWRPEPYHVRWVLLFLWAVLAVNNLFKLNYQVGTDNWGHIEYIDYIVTKGSLPRFFEGWQMHQGPLNYILSAPLYALLIKWFDLPSVVKIMGIIPVACGLFQIEMVYRIARLVFVGRKDLQIIAIVTGSLLPIHTYLCQYVGNEPVAACFMLLIIFLCVPLVMPGQKERQNGYFILIGFVWGLAILSKVTAAPLAPVLIAALVLYTVSIKKPLKSALKPVLIVFGVSLLIAGWYCLKIYTEYGNIFIERPKHSQILQWWQDPGYRTWSQILSFGQSLVYPVYSGVASFGDTLYSTLWLDGFNSGVIDFIPWNENFMIAGALLALIPSVFILSGFVSIWFNKQSVYRNAVIFSSGTIALFIVVLLDLYIFNPIYSGIKANYTLGLLPCYAILAAAGAEPFLRNRITRSLAMAFFACWAFAAYAAYFVVKFQ
jgi:hypothetical protein